jgi:hypothetical protein
MVRYPEGAVGLIGCESKSIENSASISLGEARKALTRIPNGILSGSVCILRWKSAGKSNDGSTIYNFDTIDVDGKPELAYLCLKRLVGERGFEPPTPWSRIQ